MESYYKKLCFLPNLKLLDSFMLLCLYILYQFPSNAVQYFIMSIYHFW